MGICLFRRINRKRVALARSVEVLLLVSGVSAPVMAQGPGVSIVQPSDSSTAFRRVSTVAGPQYGGGPLRRFLFGGDYRSLWTASIQVDVLDLRTYAGGLRPVSMGGGQQTHSLHLRTSDGRIFAFRSIDKDLTRALPADLRGTLIHDVVQDQAARPRGRDRHEQLGSSHDGHSKLGLESGRRLNARAPAVSSPSPFACPL